MLDLDQCSCAGNNLDKLLQPTILLLLSQQESHGYGLVDKIRESPMFNGMKPDPAGVYRTLKTMEDHGLVASRWDLVESGPPRKLYQITADGAGCLAVWMQTLKEYRASIDALLALAEKGWESSG